MARNNVDGLFKQFMIEDFKRQIIICTAVHLQSPDGASFYIAFDFDGYCTYTVPEEELIDVPNNSTEYYVDKNQNLLIKLPLIGKETFQHMSSEMHLIFLHNWQIRLLGARGRFNRYQTTFERRFKEARKLIKVAEF